MGESDLVAEILTKREQSFPLDGGRNYGKENNKSCS
jgi:hypothetical protein